MVLLFLTAPLAYMPEAVLSAVVFRIGVELIDIRRMRKIYDERPWEFWVALTTTLVVVFWGVEQGIILAIILSLLVHTRHGYRPKNVLVTSSEEGHWHTLPVSSHAQLVPAPVVYRFTHSMYYANAELLSQQILELANGAQPPLSWLCIDAAGVDDVDFTAAETLLSICGLVKKQGIRLVFADVSDDVRIDLDRSGLTGLLSEHPYYATVGEVATAYRNILTQNALQLLALSKSDPVIQRLRQVPGLGLLTSTALVAAAGCASSFKSARHFASWLGITPKESSSGNRRFLGRISKQGSTYLRTLIIHGARAVLARAKQLSRQCEQPLNRIHQWVLELERRVGHNKAAVALANKLARIAWAVWRHERDCEAAHFSEAVPA